ncbi:MAG: hypothetical protein CM1200mP1_11860 [Candidatus Neomarinimicrobiota bacterium]|nr:MAG: hypothetical protein CM1200mP1_11860 [Candidatus Neomarinimicrobiota bacterium]
MYPQAIKVSQNIIAGYPFEDVKKRNVIFDDFSKKLDKLDLSGPVKTRYSSEAEAILVTIVNSSYRKLIDFLSYKKQKQLKFWGMEIHQWSRILSIPT